MILIPSGAQIHPSQVAVGTLGMGSQVNKNVAHRILARAFELGISTIDLAPSYGEGRARSVIRDYLNKNPGQDWKLWDKMGMRMSFSAELPSFNRGFPPSTAQVVQEIENVLSQLKIDSLDVLQLHLPLQASGEMYVLEGIFESMESGLVRSFGCCNHEVDEIAILLQETKQRGQSLSQTQVQMSLIEQRATTALIPMCRNSGVKVVANRVFARGLLSYDNLDHSRRLRSSQRTQKYMADRKAAIHSLRTIIREQTSMSLSELALRWALGPGGADVAVLGFSDEEQVGSVLGNNDRTLPDGFWSSIFRDKRLRGQDFVLYPATFFDTR